MVGVKSAMCAVASLAVVVSTLARAEPPAPPPPAEPGADVVVIRGSRQEHPGVRASSPSVQVTAPGGALESGVLVMRPPRDSFLRETKRLAAAAEAREAGLASEAAEEQQRQLTRTLQAIEAAARAAEEEARTRSERYYPFYWAQPIRPRPPPPRDRPPDR